MTHIKLTRPLAAALRADHAAGLTVAECARKYVIGWPHAKRVIRGESWPDTPREPTHKVPDSKVAEVRALALAGEKIEWIALEHGLGVSTVAHYKRGSRRATA